MNPTPSFIRIVDGETGRPSGALEPPPNDDEFNPRDEDDPRAPPVGRASTVQPPLPPKPDAFAELFRFLGTEESAELLNQKPPARAYLLKYRGAGLLPRGKVGCLIAKGGAGKTMALGQLALSVAVGKPWFGTFDVDKPGRVLLALAEEDMAEIHRRLYAAAASLSLSHDERREAVRNIVALPLAGVDVALTTGDGHGNVNTTDACKQLRAHIEAAGVDWSLLVLDPLSRWAGNDVEKDNHAATRFVQVAEELTTVRGSPSVLLAHHTNKIARRTKGEADAADSRGASALTDGARWVANLEPDGSEAVVFHVTKNNYGPPIDPVVLLRERDFAGALRAMGKSELEAYEEARQQRSNRAGRAPVSDAELDDRIVAALKKHGPQRSKTALESHVAGTGKKVRQRIAALCTDGTIATSSDGRLTLQTPSESKTETTP